jgi:septum formation protein
LIPGIVLASQSAARQKVLRGARVPFVVKDAGVDEDAVKTALLAKGAGPRDVAEALAELKAVTISRTDPGFVVGADQTLEFEGRLYDKAATVDEARDRLQMLRARPHTLHAAVVVARGGVPVWRETARATLTMRAFSDAFLDDYLEREGREALGSVGCYRLEDLGAQLFSSIEGDYFAILGLPLLGLLDFLRQQGSLAT